MEQCKTLGNDAFRSKQYDVAIDQYTKGIEYSNTTSSYSTDTLATLYNNRAACYQALGKFEDALSDSTSCTSVAPTNAKGHGRRGAALWALGRYSESKAAYAEAMKYCDEGSPQMEEYKACIARTPSSSSSYSSNTSSGGGAINSSDLVVNFAIVVSAIGYFLGSFIGLGFGPILWKVGFGCSALRYFHIVRQRMGSINFTQLKAHYRTDSFQYLLIAAILGFTTSGSHESTGFLLMLMAFASYAAVDIALRNPNTIPSFAQSYLLDPQKRQMVLLNACLLELMSAFTLPLSFLMGLAMGGGSPPLMPVFFVVSFIRHRCSPKGEDKTYMPQALYAIRIAANQYLPAPLRPVYEKVTGALSAYCNAY